ncbi:MULTISPECIES: hypothetical protein [Methylobacter]
MLGEGAFYFNENPKNLLPISHATTLPVGGQQPWHAARPLVNILPYDGMRETIFYGELLETLRLMKVWDFMHHVVSVETT